MERTETTRPAWTLARAKTPQQRTEFLTEQKSGPAIGSIDVDEIVAEVNRLQRLGSLRTAREVGEYLIRVFFEGDASRIHDRRSHPASFRTLAKHPALQVSASYLFVAVAVCEQATALPSDVVASLPFRSQRHLLAVKDPEAKTELAREAIAAGWSTNAMHDRVQDTLKKMQLATRSGRPRIPEFVRALRLLRDAAEAAESAGELLEEVKRFGWCASLQEADGCQSAIEKLGNLVSALVTVTEAADAADEPDPGC